LLWAAFEDLDSPVSGSFIRQGIAILVADVAVGLLSAADDLACRVSENIGQWAEAFLDMVSELIAVQEEAVDPFVPSGVGGEWFAFVKPLTIGASPLLLLDAVPQERPVIRTVPILSPPLWIDDSLVQYLAHPIDVVAVVSEVLGHHDGVAQERLSPVRVPVQTGRCQWGGGAPMVPEGEVAGCLRVEATEEAAT